MATSPAPDPSEPPGSGSSPPEAPLRRARKRGRSPEGADGKPRGLLVPSVVVALLATVFVVVLWAGRQIASSEPPVVVWVPAAEGASDGSAALAPPDGEDVRCGPGGDPVDGTWHGATTLWRPSGHGAFVLVRSPGTSRLATFLGDLLGIAASRETAHYVDLQTVRTDDGGRRWRAFGRFDPLPSGTSAVRDLVGAWEVARTGDPSVVVHLGRDGRIRRADGTYRGSWAAGDGALRLLWVGGPDPSAGHLLEVTVLDADGRTFAGLGDPATAAGGRRVTGRRVE